MEIFEILRIEMTCPGAHSQSVTDGSQSPEVFPYFFFREIILYQSPPPSSLFSSSIFLIPLCDKISLLTFHGISISYPAYKLKPTKAKFHVLLSQTEEAGYFQGPCCAKIDLVINSNHCWSLDSTDNFTSPF